MKVLAPVLLALLSIPSSITAFVPPSPSAAATDAVSSRTVLFSATEKTSTESTTATTTYDFTPDYAAAFAKAETGLTTAVTNDKLLQPLLHFTKEYIAANQASYEATGNADASPQQAVSNIMEAIQLGIKYGTGDSKFLFGASHKALRGKQPELENGNEYDFYHFGCSFFKSVIDLDKSVVSGMANFERAAAYAAKGENVVFLANHQSEADPQVMSVCLESVGMDLAERLVYVAGHKVTTDPLAIPFSMGRNLICIHSKKHMDSEPELKSGKQRDNLMAMSGMLDLLKRGSCALWVAPSGGRDRRDLATRKVPPAPFDQKTIDMFRLMGNKSKVKTHFFPLAMVTYDLCPPPDYVEAGVGEQRNVRFVPVGISCGEELPSEGGLEKRHEFAEAAMAECVTIYDDLVKAIEEKQQQE